MYQAKAMTIKNTMCCLLLIQPILPLLFVRGLFGLIAIFDKWYIYDSSYVNKKYLKNILALSIKYQKPIKSIR